jgi:hypothetical protein
LGAEDPSTAFPAAPLRLGLTPVRRESALVAFRVDELLQPLARESAHEQRDKLRDSRVGQALQGLVRNEVDGFLRYDTAKLGLDVPNLRLDLLENGGIECGPHAVSFLFPANVMRTPDWGVGRDLRTKAKS